MILSASTMDEDMRFIQLDRAAPEQADGDDE
jgi:hypothetical protein